MKTHFTKADLITTYELEMLDNTPCELNCSGCDEYLATEGDFARHFIIRDARYLNLGECNTKMPNLPATINARTRFQIGR